MSTHVADLQKNSSWLDLYILQLFWESFIMAFCAFDVDIFKCWHFKWVSLHFHTRRSFKSVLGQITRIPEALSFPLGILMFPLTLSSGSTFLIGEMFLNHWHFREFFKLSFAEITAEGAVLSIGMATYALSDDDDREDLKACHVLPVTDCKLLHFNSKVCVS